MKIKNILFIALVSLLIISCGKPNETELTVERPTGFNFPDLSKVDVDIPKVPIYENDGTTADTRGHSIKVYPGSNQLQAIINDASPGTTIKLMEGVHQEDETLVINHEVNLRGRDGAVLQLGGALGLLITGADDVYIKDLTIENTGSSALGIGVEDSEDFEFKRNDMSGFFISIVLEQAYKASITENTISGIDQADGLGVVAMNGEKVNIRYNDISGSAFGVWACDKKGWVYNNEFHNNTFGLILCKVPAESFSDFFSIGDGGSDYPCTEWKVKNNDAHDNVWGYIVIDGAIDNFLSRNTGSNNAFVDLELAAETFNLFAMQVPGSFTNTVHADDLDYIDCGYDNTVYGGNEMGVPCSD